MAVIVTIYGYMKYKGVKLLPKAIEGELEVLSKTNSGLIMDYGELEQKVKIALGNVSFSEIQKIVSRARVLGIDGYTDEELIELGRMAVEATRN